MSSEKEILTTFEAARYCHVHPGTIKNWIRNENLKAFKTPGGHRRIYKRDLDKFLKERDIPVSQQSGGRRRRVLIIEREYRLREEITKMLHRWGAMFEVAAVSNPFEGGEMLVVFKPELVILDLQVSGMEPDELCRHIRTSVYLDQPRIIAFSDGTIGAPVDSADAVIARPVNIDRLRQEIEKLLELKKSS